MASNLECVGLSLEGRPWKRLLRAAQRDGVEVGRVGGTIVLRWEDASGATLLLELWNETVVNVVPSYAGRPGVELAGLQPFGPDLFITDVLDDDGESVTQLIVELEQRPLYVDSAEPVDAVASLVALEVDVDVRPPARDGDGDDDTAETDGGADGEDTADAVAVVGSLKPRTVNVAPALAEPKARLSGTVLDAEVRKVEATGQEIVVARVRTNGFEIDLCMPAEEFEEFPEPGDLVDGTVFLVASLKPDEAVVRTPMGERAEPAADEDEVADGADAAEADEADDSDDEKAGQAKESDQAEETERRPWWRRRRR